MRRNFSPLIGLLVAAIMLAAIPAAFAVAPGGLLHDVPQDVTPPSADNPTIPAHLRAPSPPRESAVPAAPSSALQVPQPPAPMAQPAVPAPPNVDDVLPSRVDPDLFDHDRPSVDHEINLRCIGSVDDIGAGSVECKWPARDSLVVAKWQLWNVRVRPDHGERNLVAELRPDVTSYVDRAVEVPGRYLYAVLGLNAAGEVIARSSVAPVNLVSPPVDHGVVRLKCRPAANIEQAFTVGCKWSRTESETAVGYVMWRSVDGGDRVVIARTGLDVRTLFDTDVSAGHRYIYVITAVDDAGEVVGRSRPEHVGFPGPRPGPVPHPVPVSLPGPVPYPVPLPSPGPHPAPAVGAPPPRVDLPAAARVGLSG